MKMSQLFGRKLREAPAEAESEAYRLILRAGLVRQTGAGIYSYLPLGWRVAQKVAAILRDEMERVDGQEVSLPVIVPADLWKESGRWFAIDETLWRTDDRNHRPYVLAMTHEEVVTDLTRREVNSYRQLPYTLYQIQTKVRDEPRPRGGLVRMREFHMKDAYSFHATPDDLDAYYPRMYEAYVRIYQRVGVPALPVEADPGLIGGTGSHEFVVPSALGEATIIRCAACGYAANQEVAVARKPSLDTAIAAAAPPVELVETPGAKTIADLERFFGLPADAFLKTVVYSTAGRLVMVAIRGDLDVNEVKLANYLGVPEVHLASDQELASAGLTAGYVSPVGQNKIEIVADDGVVQRAYIAGANQPDFHYRNVLPGRDFGLEHLTDIALASAGGACVRCGAVLAEDRVLEVGHTFKLGTKYSAAMSATYLDAAGDTQPIWMGCYGIGVDRLISAIVDHNHDEKGIVWPASVAPYDVQLVALNADRPEIAAAADQLYRDLQAAGLTVLYDDRSETAGVKFADADLIGLPLRLTVSPRSLKNGGAEITVRHTLQSMIVPRDEVVSAVKNHPVLRDERSI
ncbi:MAG TPA: proline--tRNA ligase [Chloroflexota bacterium]|nr:proline--tRNA ligase [Chloroflexota bacterium]